MKKFFALLSKPQTNDSRRPLIENNNNNSNDAQDGYDRVVNGYENPLAQNTFNSHTEQRLRSVEEVTPQELAELLGVDPDANTSKDDLIRRSVSKHFPKPPADLNQNLQQHLSDVQETVHNELERLGPLLESMRLMGRLIDCYHRQTFDHLNDLLQNISSSQNSFVLMKWVLRTYLSQELRGHTEPQEMDPTKVDFTLFTEFVEKAKDKVLENVQKDIREFLKNILQNERSQEGCDHEETYVQLYMDTIQCIDATIKEAQKISLELSDAVQEVCFQELLLFLRSYTAEQREILRKKAKMDKPETIHFIQTLNTCKELKQYIKTKDRRAGIRGSLFQETVAMLEEMDAFTLKLLMKIVAEIAESHLKNYFKTQNKQFFLILAVKTYFPKLLWCQDVQKRVMDEAYKLIVHVYLKHLIQRSQKKLRKCWSPDVGETVTADAKLLHNIISELAPGVQRWNLLLLKITELLECECTDSVKLTVASMQKECLTWSEDLELLPALLRWKDLSGWQVREVLDAIPGHQPRPWYSCLVCR